MKYIMSIILVFIYINLYSQQYWVNEYELGDRNHEIGLNVLAIDSLVVVTSGITCESNTKLCHKFSVYDLFGNLKYVNTYDSLVYLTGDIPHRGLVLRNNRFITAGKSVRSDNEICVIAQDINGEVIQRKFITNPYDSSLRIEPQLLLELDDYLVIVADIYGEPNTDSPYGFINQVAVYTIDPNTFEVLDEMTIKPTEFIVAINDAKATIDNHILLAVNQRVTDTFGAAQYKLQLIKIDASMNIVDSMSRAREYIMDNEERIEIGNDGRVLVTKYLSNKLTDIVSIFDFESKTIEEIIPNVSIDPNRGKVWYDIKGIKADRNGDLYVFGQLNGLNLKYTFSGFVQKLDENYNVVRERIFITNVNDIEREDRAGWSDRSSILDIFFNENNEIYFSGYINNLYREDELLHQNNNILLGKLDAESCISDTCEVEHYVGGYPKRDELVEPGKTWHIYNQTSQEVFRYRLSDESQRIADRYYLEILRSDTYDGEDFYGTGQYLRERSHLVYLRKDDQDFFLYNFDMDIGLRMSSWVYEIFEANHQMIEHDSIQLENGEMARRAKLRCSIDEDASDFGYYYWIEGIGDTKGLLAVGEACINGRESHLLCAYDGDGNIIWDNPDFDGCWITVSTKDEEGLHSQIFPNPATGYINIVNYEDYDRIAIRNLLGQVLLEANATQQMDISDLDNGCYLITLYSKGQSYTEKILKL
jgi:hypothetical protein